jgi:hypothetical protein
MWRFILYTSRNSKQFNILENRVKHKLRESFTYQISFRNTFRFDKYLAIYAQDA